MSEVLYAKPIVDSEIENLKSRISKLSQKPFLKVILVGDNPASLLYVNYKLAFCKKIDAKCEIIKLSSEISKETFLNRIQNIAADPEVTGLLIQLPLPEHLADVDFNKYVPPEKDVDGFTDKNIFSLYNNKTKDSDFFLTPCTPSGIIQMADYYNINFEGKTVAVIGRSLIVGKPLSLLLTKKNATVTLCHSKTKNLEEITKNVDIIISAMGNPQLITKKHLSKNKKQIIFDVGIKNVNKKPVGDVHFEEVKNHVQAITPVPGGIGPMTILSLAKNLVKATEQHPNNRE